MKRILAVLAVQAVLVGGYFCVESTRGVEAPFGVEELNLVAPVLVVETQTGEVDLGRLEGAVVVHFWATWCVPCRAELPLLLEATREANIHLLAVTEEPWGEVRVFFGGAVPTEVVRAGGAAKRWEVSGLPDTFVVRDGRIVARMGGARDWSTTEARTFLTSLR